MTVRHYTLLLLALVLGILTLTGLRSRTSGGNTPVAVPFTKTAAVARPPGPGRASLDGQPAMAPPDFSALATSERPPLADGLGAAETPPAREVSIILEVLEAYRRLLGAYPAGEDNRQIVNALLGANSQNIPFLPRDHPRMNEKGEIVDAWGTPFFFHFESRVSMSVRSAGPDRAMFTADDLVTASGGGPPKRRIKAEGPIGGK